MQYWIADCTDSGGLNPQTAVSQALIPLLVISPVAAYFCPDISRRHVVYASASLMIASCLIMLTSGSYTMAFIISGVFGMGYGPFLAVEFALVLDVLPSAANAARDISIWHQALVLPQLVATPLAGIMRDYFQRVGDEIGVKCFGYRCSRCNNIPVSSSCL